MKSKYLYISLESRTEPPMEDKSREGELNALWDLEKWNMSVFPYSTTRLYFKSKDKIIL